jgi:hypothetical protein
MASGTLGQSAPSATTNTTVYTVPSGKTASTTVAFCNRGNASVAVRLAVCATSTPANDEYIEFDAIIVPNGTLERSGIIASAGKLFVVYTSAATVSVNIYGYEE